jgi:hypothetical protein
MVGVSKITSGISARASSRALPGRCLRPLARRTQCRDAATRHAHLARGARSRLPSPRHGFDHRPGWPCLPGLIPSDAGLFRFVALAAPVAERLLKDAQAAGNLLQRRAGSNRLKRVPAKTRLGRYGGRGWRHMDIFCPSATVEAAKCPQARVTPRRQDTSEWVDPCHGHSGARRLRRDVSDCGKPLTGWRSAAARHAAFPIGAAQPGWEPAHRTPSPTPLLKGAP